MTDPIALTKEDIQALRGADRLVFLHEAGTTGKYGVGDGTVKCIKEGKNIRVPGFEPEHSAPNLERRLPAKSRITDYGAKYLSDIPLTAHAAHVEQTYVDSHINTIVRFLRAGDFVTLEWWRDNNSLTIEKGGLHVDQLSLSVGRGEKIYKFRVAFTITPNNSARMIRY